MRSLVALAALLVAVCSAVVVHVDDSAAAGGDGTSESPYRTISDAFGHGSTVSEIRVKDNGNEYAFGSSRNISSSLKITSIGDAAPTLVSSTSGRILNISSVTSTLALHLENLNIKVARNPNSSTRAVVYSSLSGTPDYSVVLRDLTFDFSQTTDAPVATANNVHAIFFTAAKTVTIDNVTVKEFGNDPAGLFGVVKIYHQGTTSSATSITNLVVSSPTTGFRATSFDVIYVSNVATLTVDGVELETRGDAYDSVRSVLSAYRVKDSASISDIKVSGLETGEVVKLAAIETDVTVEIEDVTVEDIGSDYDLTGISAFSSYQVTAGRRAARHVVESMSASDLTFSLADPGNVGYIVAARAYTDFSVKNFTIANVHHEGPASRDERRMRADASTDVAVINAKDSVISDTLTVRNVTFAGVSNTSGFSTHALHNLIQVRGANVANAVVEDVKVVGEMLYRSVVSVSNGATASLADVSVKAGTATYLVHVGTDATVSLAGLTVEGGMVASSLLTADGGDLVVKEDVVVKNVELEVGGDGTSATTVASMRASSTITSDDGVTFKLGLDAVELMDDVDARPFKSWSTDDDLTVAVELVGCGVSPLPTNSITFCETVTPPGDLRREATCTATVTDSREEECPSDDDGEGDDGEGDDVNNDDGAISPASTTTPSSSLAWAALVLASLACVF